MTPPAAPVPMTTKSTSSFGLYFFMVSGLVIGAERGAEVEAVVEADLLPAELVEIAAMLGSAEHAHDGVVAHGLEEGRLLDPGQQRHLVGGGQRTQRFAAGLGRQFAKALGINRLLVG